MAVSAGQNRLMPKTREALTFARLRGWEALMGHSIMFPIIVLFYFLPTIVAVAENKNNKAGIFLVNLFLGWTLIGWFAALIWAAMEERPMFVYAATGPQTRGYCQYCGAPRYGGGFCWRCGRKFPT